MTAVLKEGTWGNLRAPFLLAMDARDVCLRFGRPKALLQGPPPIIQGWACSSIALSLLLALDSRAVITEYHRLWLKRGSFSPQNSRLEARHQGAGRAGVRPPLGL